MAKKTTVEKQNRPPIISIMGHVDHGKTTLMDYIQSSNIAQREAGGITQSIRSFHVDHNGTPLTFIDTPGHEAFAKMRERGSKLSDIVLLVVAADDGVKPQTKEVINLVLKDKIPMVVAINKIDLPGADVNRVKMELSQNGVLLEGWGGDTVAVEISAKTGKNVDGLLDMLVLVSQLEDLTYDDKVNMSIVLESYINKTSGPESLVIIKSGKYRVGDFVVGDGEYGKIRALINDKGERVNEAGASMPVKILGLSSVLTTGEEIYSAADKKEALAHMRIVAEEKEKEAALIESQKSPLELLDELLKNTATQEEKPVLNVILKTDFAGSLEAITNAIKESSNENVDINILKSGTGEITESDISYAKSAKAAVIGFNAALSSRIKSIAEKERVIIMNYSIIYELIDDVLSAAESLIPPEKVEVVIGNAEVIDTFTLSNGNHVAGCLVKDGRIARGYNVYVMRRKERVFEGKITSIRHLKDEIKEAQKGMDCGVSAAPDFEYEKGDVIYCFRIEKN